jgi:hypothetical protein
MIRDQSGSVVRRGVVRRGVEVRSAEVRVFAVETDVAQLTWSRLRAGELRVTGEGVDVHAEVGDGPGALTVDGLRPGTHHELTVAGAGLAEPVRLDLVTLEPPPGRELMRIGTMSDLHIGKDAFDLGGRIREDPPPAELHPVRAARAARREMEAWGADRLVLKGDLANTAQPAEWHTLGQLFADAPVPVDVLPGNHDVRMIEGSIDPVGGARLAGFDLVRDPVARDLPGIRMVLFDSTVAGLHRGTVTDARQRDVVELLESTELPVVVMTHHHFQSTRLPRYWPPGIPASQSIRFLDAVAAAKPTAFLSSGHTHRHRRHVHGGLVHTEVGAPSDYPATWAGYVIHEGGIRQVVRRIEEPSILRFSERVRSAALTMWGRWSPGTLGDRCFTHGWSEAG